MIDLPRISRALGAHQPILASGADEPGAGESRTQEKTPAAVAMLFREGSAGVEVLYIERARVDGDPWSGHIAFPGGRLEPRDQGPRQAAERETCEEVGLDLSAAAYLGRLDDVTASSLTVRVSGFAYALPEAPPDLVLSCEVAEAFWVPLRHLVDPARQRLETFPRRSGRRSQLPAIDLLGPGRPLLWGVTYRFTARALEILGLPLPTVPQLGAAAASTPVTADG